ncbi:magnesium transporter MgtE [Companilactobacillus sp. RD055328]|uniref:magnesium transporter n=1 Tax=Companilactobacillus sp. RD055328 TaxID=2916634 RepID=UPI001FC8A146|nr:magnesium transporter [Companilactobacillus sp. RD055328]GKQ43081.1 magnesium transporter MgtE [Companilactobacillus sp. RD055328]
MGNNIENEYEVLAELLRGNDNKKFRKRFLDMHFYEQSEFYLTLKQDDRLKLYTILQPDETADMFDTIEEDLPELPEFLEEMDVEYAADMLNNMYDDNAADILEHLETPEIDRYLSRMPRADANNLRGLLHYDTQTAGGLMTTDYVSFTADQTVKAATAELKEEAKDAETINALFVVDENGDLTGVLSLRELVLNSDNKKLGNIMNQHVISINVDADQAEVAQVFRDYEFLVMPVVDHANRMVGIITVDDVIEIIDDEAQSDYSGLAGVDVDEAITESPVRAATKRLPWLITLLFLGMITATLISHFEILLSQASILAVFITLITGTAGNAGTQSLAVAVRRLAIVKEDEEFRVGKLILREIFTGVLTGVITGAVIWLVVGLWQNNFILGFVIGLAMMVAITVANLAGSLIPIIMEKLGFDPAVASGPFISTLSDLTSVLIYFNIASLFMKFFM